MKSSTRLLLLVLILPAIIFGAVPPTAFARPVIIGGEDAKPGDFPFIVALVSADDGSQFCGGSLIDKAWVLTAAHCFFTEDTPPEQDTFEADVKVKIGIVDLTDPLAQVVNVTKIFQPGYDGDIHDIALLKLATPAKVDNKLVSLVKINENPQFPPLDSKVKLAGWGATDPDGTTSPDVLKKVTLPLLTCDSDVANEYVCAGDKKGKDSCQGDSGGPLVVAQDTNAPGTPNATAPQPGIYAIQIGIVSFGGDKCFDRSAYTRTSAYKEWIAKTIAENSP